jgi:hypothetical protein
VGVCEGTVVENGTNVEEALTAAAGDTNIGGDVDVGVGVALVRVLISHPSTPAVTNANKNTCEKRLRVTK